jgi:hypothetical protein
LAFFASINRETHLFGAFFIIQALLFLAWEVHKSPARFRLRADVRGMAAAPLLTYSLVAYPVLGYLFGRVYPAATFRVPLNHLHLYTAALR